MNQLTLQLPIEFEIIQKTLIRKNWIVSPFVAAETELYNPANYVYNKKSDGVRYSLILDRNLFSFIISAARKSKQKQIYRDAIALIVFCQVAKIVIEPNMAVYEKINLDRNNADEAVDELEIFYRIDNTSNEKLMNYAIGVSNTISSLTKKNFDKNSIKNRLVKHKWLAEWRSLYLIILNLVCISEQKNNNNEKLEQFISWMVADFRLSLVSIVYAIFLFSSIRKKKMIKFKQEDSISVRQQQLKNMTWDLFFVNNFFRKWIGKDSSEEFFVATDDKLVQEILEKALIVQNKQKIDSLKKFLHQNERHILEIIIKKINNTKSRTYNSDRWSLEYRDELISEKETLLLS